MPHFLCRLSPPRASLGADMTPEEGALMQAHAAYLGSQAGVVVFGPVADPAGFWGLMILEAQDEAAVRAVTDQDPTIRAGAGFRYDILPMPMTVVRSSASS